MLFADAKRKVPPEYLEANCLCGPGETYYYVNKDGNLKPIFALIQHKTYPGNNISMFPEPHLPCLEGLGLIVIRYVARIVFVPGNELFSDYWVREGGKWYQYHQEGGPSGYMNKDGTFFQVEDDDSDSDFEPKKSAKKTAITSKKSAKKTAIKSDSKDSNKVEWLPPVDSMVTSCTICIILVHASSSYPTCNILLLLSSPPPFPHKCHIDWPDGTKWRARSRGYLINTKEIICCQFVFANNEVWDCDLIEFNKRVQLESDVMDIHGIPDWIPTKGTKYDYRKPSDHKFCSVEVLGNTSSSY